MAIPPEPQRPDLELESWLAELDGRLSNLEKRSVPDRSTTVEKAIGWTGAGSTIVGLGLAIPTGGFSLILSGLGVGTLAADHWFRRRREARQNADIAEIRQIREEISRLRKRLKGEPLNP